MLYLKKNLMLLAVNKIVLNLHSTVIKIIICIYKYSSKYSIKNHNNTPVYKYTLNRLFLLQLLGIIYRNIDKNNVFNDKLLKIQDNYSNLRLQKQAY